MTRDEDSSEEAWRMARASGRPACASIPNEVQAGPVPPDQLAHDSGLIETVMKLKEELEGIRTICTNQAGRGSLGQNNYRHDHNRSPFIRCFYCRQKGHFIRDCPTRPPKKWRDPMRPAWFSQNFRNVSELAPQYQNLPHSSRPDMHRNVPPNGLGLAPVAKGQPDQQ